MVLYLCFVKLLLLNGYMENTESEFRSRSPGVKFMENTESKIWKRRGLI